MSAIVWPGVCRSTVLSILEGSRISCSSLEGTDRGCPCGGWREGGVRESWRVRGHTRGVHLRGMAGRWGQGVVARTRAHTRGAPAGDWREGGVRESWRVRGHPQGVPLRGHWQDSAFLVLWGWAPTRGAPTMGWPGGRGRRRALCLRVDRRWSSGLEREWIG